MLLQWWWIIVMHWWWIVVIRRIDRVALQRRFKSFVPAQIARRIAQIQPIVGNNRICWRIGKFAPIFIVILFWSPTNTIIVDRWFRVFSITPRWIAMTRFPTVTIFVDRRFSTMIMISFPAIARRWWSFGWFPTASMIVIDRWVLSTMMIDWFPTAPARNRLMIIRRFPTPVCNLIVGCGRFVASIAPSLFATTIVVRWSWTWSRSRTRTWTWSRSARSK